MDEKKINKNYIEKINLINNYNKKYFNENISEISDSEYDLLKKELLNLEKRYPYLKNNKSPSLKVGYKPSKNFKKSSHKVPMLSLGKYLVKYDLINFEKKILNYLINHNNEEI
jgi:DNA ligase (NAD+)